MPSLVNWKLWSKMVRYINANSVVQRREMHSQLGRPYKQKKRKSTSRFTSPVDSYRGVFCRLRYLEKVAPGVYRKIKEIPTDLSVSKAHQILKEKENVAIQ